MDKVKQILSDLWQKSKDILMPVAVLTAICVIISAALSLTNLLTADKIADIEKENQNKAMATLIPDCEYEDLLNYLTFDKAFPVTAFYAAKSGDEIKGYIVTSSAKGYGGEVKIMTAISPDKKVIGVNVLSIADETPGLGQNVGKPDFYGQFKDKTKNIILIKNGADSAKNEINAVTGATISSKAATNAVNAALEVIDEYFAIQEVAQ